MCLLRYIIRLIIFFKNTCHIYYIDMVLPSRWLLILIHNTRLWTTVLIVMAVTIQYDLAFVTIAMLIWFLPICMYMIIWHIPYVYHLVLYYFILDKFTSKWLNWYDHFPSLFSGILPDDHNYKNIWNNDVHIEFLPDIQFLELH